jgi:hypothetical protein
VYRGGGKRGWDGAAIDESLDLLTDHDYENLRHKRPKHVPTRGAPTWASLAQGAAAAIAAALVGARADDALEAAIDRGRALRTRLQARRARVPNELRHTIETVGAASDALADLRALRDGKPATFAMAERLLSLRMRLGRLGLTQNAWLRTCVERAAAAVLGSQAASPGLKAMLTRVAAQWLPPPPAAPTGGVQVQWSDSDDDGF